MQAHRHHHARRLSGAPHTADAGSAPARTALSKRPRCVLEPCAHPGASSRYRGTGREGARHAVSHIPRQGHALPGRYAPSRIKARFTLKTARQRARTTTPYRAAEAASGGSPTLSTTTPARALACPPSGGSRLASLTWTQSAGPAMDKMRPPRDRDSGHLAPPEECRPGTLRRRPRPCRSPKKMAPPGRPASRRRGSTSPSVGTTPAPRMDRRSACRWRRTRRPVAPQAVARYRCRRTPAPRAVGA